MQTQQEELVPVSGDGYRTAVRMSGWYGATSSSLCGCDPAFTKAVSKSLARQNDILCSAGTMISDKSLISEWPSSQMPTCY